jgi:hypothetical protein
VQAVKTVLISNAISFGVSLALGQALCDPKDIPMQRPIKVKQVRGMVVDTTGGVIPNVQVEIRREKHGKFQMVASFHTNQVGKVEPKQLAEDEYRVDVTGPKGFCRIVVPVEISKTGWNGFRLELPIGASDTCPSDCQTRYRLDEDEE